MKKKRIKIVTSRRKLLEARLNDLITTLYFDDKVKVKDYYKCLKHIDEIRKILKFE